MSIAADRQNHLDGQVTVVTGASSGIGAAVARRFAAAGSRVVVSARREARVREVAGQIEAAGGRALAFPADVTDYAQLENLVAAARREFGQIDHFVNNAGHAVAKPLVDSSIEELDAQIDANLRGVVYGCRAVLPHMIQRHKGHIVTIGSICSVNHYPNYGAYVAAKHAVLGFSRSVYEEVRPFGIRMSVLCPAAVNTAWSDLAGAELPWPRHERLQPEDLAEMALFCVTLPARVQVESLVVWPVCEPTV
jgi:NADP-dependent 3-hydroxy acid dehydrogenase YdfG